MNARLDIDWDSQPIGRVPDPEIAGVLGCSAVTVGTARRARGIAPYHRGARRIKRVDLLHAVRGKVGTMTDRRLAESCDLSLSQARRARLLMAMPSTRINWSDQPLGSVPDIVLAHKMGVDHTVVAQARWRRGISKWSEERRCPCGHRFDAMHRRQRFCEYRCQRWHWYLVAKKNFDPRVADLMVALWRLKKTTKERANGLENI